MTELKSKRRRRPFRNLLPGEVFDMDDFFDRRFWNRDLRNTAFWNGKSHAPALNVMELENHFEIELAAPGFEKKDFEITVENGYLNIKAEKEEASEAKEEDYTRKEFNYQAFERGLLLPDNVENEAIEAQYTNGILRFNLAKKADSPANKPRKVEIR